MTTFNTAEDVLEHFGIKGMKWGVRKSPEREARKIAKQDLAFEKAARNSHTHQLLWMQSVKTLKKSGDLKAINNRPEFAAAKFRLHLGVANRDLQKKYEDVVAGALVSHIRKNADQIVNRSGTRKFAVDQVYRATGKKGQKVIRESKSQWRIVTTDIQQSDDGSLLITLVRDSVGRIIDLIPEDVDLQQSDLVGPFLEHFGIKGMKWGVRRKARPLSTDAKSKQAVKDKVKQDKVGSVSNLKLQQAIRRMQLEQDYKRLSVNEKNGVARWLSSMMLEIGKKEVQAYAAKKVALGIAKATVGAA